MKIRWTRTFNGAHGGLYDILKERGAYVVCYRGSRLLWDDGTPMFLRTLARAKRMAQALAETK